jgi:N-acetylglucosamine-6-phosphate deacetylase
MNVPGFIDLQVNGYAGIDFHDPETTVDDILQVAEILAAKGTAGFLPTVITTDRETIEKCITTITKALQKQGEGGNILGIHLEGPFISHEYGYRGAHPKHAVIPPDIEWFQRLQKISAGHLRIITIAPEYKNAAEFIRTIVPEVIVSIGHSNCSFDKITEAVHAGLTMATHIGNGCVQTIDRHNNPIVNILGCSEITLSFIPDGFHLPEAFIRMIVNCRPIDKLIVVSDSVMHAGMQPGEYENASGIKINLGNDGKLCLAADPEVMAGSSYTILQCMNYLASLDILDETALWKIGFFNPLRILGFDPGEIENRGNNLSYNSESKQFDIGIKLRKG